MITTRIKLTSSGTYLAEYKWLKFFWASCFNNYGWSGEAYPKTYLSEKDAIEACKNYCKEQREIRRKKRATEDYTPKEFTCKDLL